MARYTAYVLAVLNSVSTSDAAFLSPSLPSPFHASSNLKIPRQHPISRKQLTATSFGPRPLYMSNVGGDDRNNGNNSNKGGANLDDFLNPRKASEESDNLKRARAALSDTSLPINFDELDTNDSNSTTDESQPQGQKNVGMESQSSPETEKAETDGSKPGSLAPSSLANNDYLNVVSKLSPSDLISKFTSTADPRVQDAVRSTILGLIGTLPRVAFETTTITTGDRLASLMFQLQMTGYMFKNAEYRLSLSQSLGIDETMGKYLLDQVEGSLVESIGDEGDDDEGKTTGADTKIKGKIKVRYEKKSDSDAAKKIEESDSEDQDGEPSSDDLPSSSPAMEVEVDAAAYMAELRNEVSKLRDDLTSTRQTNDETVRKDLLLYIRTLPQQELNTLTNSMTDDVLGAMKGLVNVVIGGIGEGQIDKNTVTEQSGEAMAQLCMWQLVVGYNLRELEVREEMKNALASGNVEDDGIVQGGDNDESDGSIDYEEGGFA
jgi:uncharacterized protein YjbJ (UPF0337 family)